MWTSLSRLKWVEYIADVIGNKSSTFEKKWDAKCWCYDKNQSSANKMGSANKNWTLIYVYKNIGNKLNFKRIDLK